MKTKAEYEAYQASVDNFLNVNQVRPGCFSSVEEEPEGFFSWRPCECCGSSLGGTREHYRFAQESGGIFEADICVDCIHYLTYGELDDATMMEIDGGAQ